MEKTKMKRLMVTIGVIGVIVLPISAITLHTNTVNGVSWIFTVQDGVASLGGGSSSTPALLPGTKGDLTVPSKLRDHTLTEYTVTDISSCAFANFTNITSITVPKSIVTIQSAAFMGCNSLTNMVLPFVGNRRTFLDTDYHDSWTPELFGYVFGKSSVEGMIEIRQWNRSGNLTGGQYYVTFDVPASLEAVTITDEERFYFAVFEDCRMIKSFTFPSCLKEIDPEAFQGCNKLREFHISDLAAWCSVACSYIEYPRDLYLNGKLVCDLVIPNGIRKISNAAFSGCTNITSVTIPSSVTDISYASFVGCSSITNMILPFVGQEMADGSYDHPFGQQFGIYSDYDGFVPVTQKHASESWTQSTYYVPQGLKSVSISKEGRIGYGAFQNCNMIEEITLGGSVTNISYNAFNKCSGLKRLVFLGDAPKIVNSMAFSDLNPACIFYVLRSSTGWGVNIPGIWNGFELRYLEGDGITIDQDLPHAVDDVPYSVQLSATGGTPPYVWSMDYSQDGRLTNDGILNVYTTDRDITISQSIDFNVTVTDIRGMQTKQTIPVVIDPNLNLRPVVERQTPEWNSVSGIARIGETNTFAVDAYDPEGTPLTFFWILDGSRLDCTTNVWTWIPEREDLGTHLLEAYCSDGERWSLMSPYWAFTVVSTNVLNVTTNLPHAVVGQPYATAISVSGGTEPYSFTLNMYQVNMNREANTFTKTGTAQSWVGDDKCWHLTLPFAFPFYGSTYEEIWVSDNGTICLDGEFSRFYFSESWFRGRALIAPLWRDYNGNNQTIFVEDSVPGQVTIRWQSKVYGSNSDTHFSTTLCSDGTIRFSYGNSCTSGRIGISAGNGNYFLPNGLQSVDMSCTNDFVFTVENIVPGLNPTSVGTIMGTPSHEGRYIIPVRVVDADVVTWNGVAELRVLPNDNYTKTSPEPIPYSYFDTAFPTLLTTYGGEYEIAANSMAANGVNKVWECYVVGINPTNETARFEASITVDANGKPIVRWSPDLNENATKNERIYRILGTKTLDVGIEWDDVTDMADFSAEGYRFFKVKVKMP